MIHFRPENVDPTIYDIWWEDNWLSNSLAYISHHLMSKWCKSEGHWTSQLTQYLFTDCPCCLLFRGITVGMYVGFFLSLIVVAVINAIL